MSMIEGNKGMRKILERPGSLVEGEKYLLIQRENCRQNPLQELVIFVGCTPCPATVIVLDQQLRRLDCGRVALFAVSFP